MQDDQALRFVYYEWLYFITPTVIQRNAGTPRDERVLNNHMSAFQLSIKC